MALINEGGETLQTKLPKVIGPTAHGVIDYVLREFGRSPRPRKRQTQILKSEIDSMLECAEYRSGDPRRVPSIPITEP
jgi:hypothetical protein